MDDGIVGQIHGMIRMRYRLNHRPILEERLKNGLDRRTALDGLFRGEWWMHALYLAIYYDITCIAKVETIKAFDLCGEFDGESSGGQ